jgi:S1-C subfamily serine protease
MEVINFDHVSKQFLLKRDRRNSFHERVTEMFKPSLPDEEFWALRDVSFSVKRGETVGLIGHNGSGKSTTLKLISRILEPSAGVVSVIGGPLRTGRRRAIDQVIRTTAPMHDGFAGGACLDASGGLLGVATAAEIRGLGVIIPAAIAWKAAAAVLEHGGMKRGFLGIAGQPVSLPEGQRVDEGREHAVLVTAVTAQSPAARAGILVGDVIVTLDGHPIESPEDLLDLLIGDRVGQQATLGVLRGGAARDIVVTVGERPRG